MLLQRHQRIEDKKYLKWIRTLPCVVSGQTGDIQASHVRMTDRRYGRVNPGGGSKPDDYCTVAGNYHVNFKYSQHESKDGERKWWERYGIDPHAVATVLYRLWIDYADNHSDRDDMARDILHAWRFWNI